MEEGEVVVMEQAMEGEERAGQRVGQVMEGAMVEVTVT